MDDDTSTDPFLKAIGRELRRARNAAGLSRAELAPKVDVHLQSLASYERGERQCTLGRFADICRALGVLPSDLISWAWQRARMDLESTGILVDLLAVQRDKRNELLPLRRWARQRLIDGPDAELVRLDWATVCEMAIMMKIPRDTFINHLIEFTPRPLPRPR